MPLPQPLAAWTAGRTAMAAPCELRRQQGAPQQRLAEAVAVQRCGALRWQRQREPQEWRARRHCCRRRHHHRRRRHLRRRRPDPAPTTARPGPFAPRSPSSRRALGQGA
eukprot:5804236-Prymnesium_polylepis.1